MKRREFITLIGGARAATQPPDEKYQLVSEHEPYRHGYCRSKRATCEDGKPKLNDHAHPMPQATAAPG